MEIDVIALEKHLRQTRTSIDQLRAPSAPGVYACFLIEGSALQPFTSGADGLVYVGVSSNLAQREFDNHFDSESTGFSTLRRSLGAILKHSLDLKALPRSAGASESNVRCYRFAEDGECRLTQWMRDNIEVGVCGVGLASDLETILITRMRPLLNLKGWPNPARSVRKLDRAAA